MQTAENVRVIVMSSIADANIDYLEFLEEKGIRIDWAYNDTSNEAKLIFLDKKLDQIDEGRAILLLSSNNVELLRDSLDIAKNHARRVFITPKIV